MWIWWYIGFFVNGEVYFIVLIVVKCFFVR